MEIFRFYTWFIVLDFFVYGKRTVEDKYAKNILKVNMKINLSLAASEKYKLNMTTFKNVQPK